MSEGVTIGFLIVALLFGGIGLVLFKEARTHRFWRQLVAQNDLEAIRGIMDREVERWKTQRPPKGVSAVVWAGVQGMDVAAASARYVRVSTSAAPEFGAVDGRRQQVASSLDVAYEAAMRLVEMIFYDVPDFRPGAVRVDVYATFSDVAGETASHPILSVSADRREAMAIDWDLPARVIAAEFRTTVNRAPNGEGQPIELPPEDAELAASAEAEAETEAAEAAEKA